MATFQEFLTALLDSVADAGPKFADIAIRDPISAVLVAFGGLFVFVSVAVLGGLTVGAVIDFLTTSVGRRPPREAR